MVQTEEELEKKRKEQAALPRSKAPVTKGTGGTQRPGVASVGDRTFVGLSPEDVALIQQQQGTAQPFTSDLSGEKFLRGVESAQEGLPLSPIQQELERQGGAQPIEGIAERGTERVAELGLLPAVGLGNLITAGLEQVTGKEFGRSNAAELADSDFGKVLGVSGVAVAGTLLGSAAITGVGAATAAITAKLGGLIGGGAVAGAGITTLGLVGFNKDTILDIILKREKTEELQGAITTIGQMQTDIVSLVQSGGIPSTVGIARINQLEDDLNILDQRIQQALILTPSARAEGKQFDIIADIQDSRTQLEEARSAILGIVPQFNPSQTTEILQRLQEIEGVKGGK